MKLVLFGNNNKISPGMLLPGLLSIDSGIIIIIIITIITIIIIMLIIMIMIVILIMRILSPHKWAPIIGAPDKQGHPYDHICEVKIDIDKRRVHGDHHASPSNT